MTTRQFYVPGISAGKSQAQILDLQRRVVEAQEQILDLQRRVVGAQCETETAERLAAERLKGLQRQEKQIKALERELLREKAINDALAEANRNGRKRLEEARELEDRNENQRQLIQALRERSAEALIQRIRDDMAQVEMYQSKVSFDHLRQILEAYERQGFGDEQ